MPCGGAPNDRRAQEPKTQMSIPHLLVHDKQDNVGVVVVENLTAGTEMLCVVTEDNSDFGLVVNDDVPIGHKSH